ncbi:MAG: extracellular solute-binding protein [Firmicutes bacterium]|nr:extracellular solute-binding protein [Bacillota bacterium]
MKKKLLQVCLTFCVLCCCLVLSACGSGGGQGQADGSLIYNAEYIPLPEDLGSVSNLCYHDGMLYFLTLGVTGQDQPADALQPGDPEYYEGMYDTYGYRLCKMNPDGSGFEVLPNYQTPSLPGNASDVDISPNYLHVDAEGNLWINESGYLYHIDADANWIDDGAVNYMRKLDATGKEILSVDLAELQPENDEEYFYISYICTDKDGNLYLSSDTTVYVYDGSGQKLFDLSVAGWINGIYRLSDGSVGAASYEDAGQVMKKIDVAAKDWGKSFTMPLSAYNMISGGGDYDFYYQNGANLYGYNLAKEKEQKVLNWIDSDINSDSLENLTVLEDGRIVCVNYIYDYSYSDESTGSQQELIILTKADPSTIVEKTDLTMAVMWLDSDLRNAVINFNKNNDQYRIHIVDYSEYNSEEDYNAGITKLNTEIISGNVPDILDVSSLSVQKYISKGLLEDLYAYLDADEELSREDLVPSIAKALEIDGKLYQAFPSFYISTLIGPSAAVGEDMGWTMDEFAAAWDKLPEGAVPLDYMSKSDFLTAICMLNIEDYVDWQSGQCRFDSPDFIKLLELANRFPETYDWESEAEENVYEKIQSGKVLLSQVSFGDFQEYQTYKQLYGGKMTYIGYPCAQGSGSVAIVNTGLAMSAKCQHKEGAWQFIRTLFTEDYQKKYAWWGYPSNKNLLEKKKAEAMKAETADEYGNVVAVSVDSMGFDDMDFEPYPMTEEDAAQLMALIDSVESTTGYDENMMKIIQEEAAPFFAGQKNAQETATIIQSRVNIYVNEQK